MPRTPKRPKPSPEPTTGDPSADVLATLRNEKLPQSRRAAEARWCIKHSIHTAVALRVLRDILKSPDKSMRKGKRLDMARRLVLKHEPKLVQATRPTYLSKKWGPYIPGAKYNPRIVFTDDPDLQASTLKDWEEGRIPLLGGRP